ncbi:MAG: hypothetical protein QNJ98_19250 [Planctomycetota bacterium]|nr:hypothetical protein [Planctomycetota bacterium]
MRTPATPLCVLALSLLIGACGGSRPSPEDFLPPPDPFPDQVRAIVETCAVPDLQQLFALLDVFDALLDPDVADPPLLFTGLRVIEGCIDWTLDTDADGIADVSGSFCFRDASGAPVFPFNPVNIGNGVAEVADLLATLPDGTDVVVAFSQGGAGTGALTVQFEEGRPRTGSGSVTYARDDCTTVYGFTDVQTQNLLAPRPNALITLTLDSPEGQAVGTFSMNGTPEGVLSMTKDDRVVVFLVDLDSFELRGFQDPQD